MGKYKQLHTDAISPYTRAKAGLKERFFCARFDPACEIQPPLGPEPGQLSGLPPGDAHRFGWRFACHDVSCPASHLNFHGH
jgi:hypothetical protein